MKYNLLSENEKIQVVKGYNSSNKNLCLLKTSIVTDGNISFCTDYAPQPILGYSFEDYRNPYVDTLAKSELEIAGASYVIKTLIAKEWLCLSGKSTFVDSIKSMAIFVKEPKNEQTMEKVEIEIRRICSIYRNSIDIPNMNSDNTKTRKKQ